MQSEHGLLGEIDIENTKDDKIVGKDEFEAITINKEQFLSLVSDMNIKVKTVEIDESSIFFEIIK